MILQDSVHYKRNSLVTGYWKACVIGARILLSNALKVKKMQHQEDLSRHLEQLSQKQLHDIGFSDPQVQIRSLGRYLDKDAANRRSCVKCTGRLNQEPWHY